MGATDAVQALIVIAMITTVAPWMVRLIDDLDGERWGFAVMTVGFMTVTIGLYSFGLNLDVGEIAHFLGRTESQVVVGAGVIDLFFVFFVTKPWQPWEQQ